jgi:hypothetical protein
MKSKRFPKDPNGTQHFGIIALVAVAVIAAGGGVILGISIGKKKKG